MTAAPRSDIQTDMDDKAKEEARSQLISDLTFIRDSRTIDESEINSISRSSLSDAFYAAGIDNPYAEARKYSLGLESLELACKMLNVPTSSIPEKARL